LSDERRDLKKEVMHDRQHKTAWHISGTIKTIKLLAVCRGPSFAPEIERRFLKIQY
jgi:hypothetical protein